MRDALLVVDPIQRVDDEDGDARCGAATETCVVQSAIEGKVLGFTVAILADACVEPATGSPRRSGRSADRPT